MTIELMHDIAALRRLQPHNLLTLRVCDALERALIKPLTVNEPKPDVNKADKEGRNQYMREYMRNRRAEKANAPKS